MTGSYRRCFYIGFVLAIVSVITTLALYYQHTSFLSKTPLNTFTVSVNSTNSTFGFKSLVVTIAKSPERTPPTNSTSSLTIDGTPSSTPLSAKYHEISGLNRPSRLVKLDWVSLYGTNENNSYNFFSAYYDHRPTAADLHRPAVILMGYVKKSVATKDIYCLFRYATGSEKCLKEPAIMKQSSSCFTPYNFSARSYHYLCKMKVGDTPPLTVRVSTSEHCEPKYTSEEIPVKNRNADMARTPPKKFGVCIQGPLTQEDFALKDVVEFVEMSTTLGAELIVLYVNETQVDVKILEHIWNYYPDTVRTIGWKKFKKWSPMHYYGQLLVISDCLYRTMYEVDYLAMIDLDEMILPVKHNSWSEMVQSLTPTPATSSLKFQNTFLTEPNNVKPATISNCSNHTVPKYFSRTKHHICSPGFGYRPKLMTRPRFVVVYAIHDICSRVRGHEMRKNVPTSTGVLGHYRESIPPDCKRPRISKNTVALKFKDTVVNRMCSRV